MARTHKTTKNNDINIIKRAKQMTIYKWNLYLKGSKQENTDRIPNTDATVAVATHSMMSFLLLSHECLRDKGLLCYSHKCSHKQDSSRQNTIYYTNTDATMCPLLLLQPTHIRFLSFLRIENKKCYYLYYWFFCIL